MHGRKEINNDSVGINNDNWAINIDSCGERGGSLGIGVDSRERMNVGWEKKNGWCCVIDVWWLGSGDRGGINNDSVGINNDSVVINMGRMVVRNADWLMEGCEWCD